MMHSEEQAYFRTDDSGQRSVEEDWQDAKERALLKMTGQDLIDALAEDWPATADHLANLVKLDRSADIGVLVCERVRKYAASHIASVRSF